MQCSTKQSLPYLNAIGSLRSYYPAIINHNEPPLTTTNDHPLETGMTEEKRLAMGMREEMVQACEKSLAQRACS